MERFYLWDTVPGLIKGIENEQIPHMDYYPCEGAKACIIVCPGGGYQALCESYEGYEIAEELNKQGFAAFVLYYRIAPYCYPSMLADGHRAVRFIRHNADKFGIDKDKIGALGFSAGGNLVAQMATAEHTTLENSLDAIDRESSKLNAAVLCYAVATFSEFTHDGTRDSYIGQENSTDDIAKLYSPELHISEEFTPPCFIWATSDDEAVDSRNSLLFAINCKKHNIPFELHIFPHGRHGLGLASDMPNSAGQWFGLLAKWLRGLDF